MRTKEELDLKRKIFSMDNGIKYDNGKARWDLLPWRETEEVVKVITNGLKKYPEGNWKKVKDGKKRYIAAAFRHIVSWITGKKYDTGKDGDGLHHLAHAICCLLFILWFDMEEENAKNNKDAEGNKTHKREDTKRNMESWKEGPFNQDDFRTS